MDSQDDLFATVQPAVKAALARAVPEVMTLAERFLAAVEAQYGPLPPEAPVNGRTIRQGCRFCGGKGCLACDALAEEEYRRQFPHGPQPIITFRRDDPISQEQMQQLLKGIMEQAQSAITAARMQGRDDV